MQVRGNFAVLLAFRWTLIRMKRLDIVWTHSMQFDDLALIVRTHNAYCMDRSKASPELSHDTQRNCRLDERLRAFETTRVNHHASLQSGAHAFAAPQTTTRPRTNI
jgi:hypothetical protein